MRKTIRKTINLSIYAGLFAYFSFFSGPIQQNVEKMTTAIGNIASFGKGQTLDIGNHPFY